MLFPLALPLTLLTAASKAPVLGSGCVQAIYQIWKTIRRLSPSGGLHHEAGLFNKHRQVSFHGAATQILHYTQTNHGQDLHPSS